MTDDRLKIWLNFLKWFLSAIVITGGIAWTTTIINAKHKDTELKIKINQEEKEYLISFLERALDDNLEKRFRFAQYFANVTSSSEYKKGWQSYLDTVKKEVDAIKTEKRELEQGLNKKEGEELNIAKERIRVLQRQLEMTSSGTLKDELTKHPLHSIEPLLSYKIDCPKDFVPGIWPEKISPPSGLKEFPPTAYYITSGCINKDGNERGPFVSFYPDGKIIAEGTNPGKLTVYYPGGQKACEGRLAGEWASYIKRWAPDGTLLE